MLVLGVPYLDLGRSLKGVDCLGVVLMFYRFVAGLDLWDPISMNPSDVEVPRFMDQFVTIESPREGCAVNFKSPTGGFHVGISLRGSILQAASNETGVFAIPERRMHIQRLGYYWPKGLERLPSPQ